MKQENDSFRLTVMDKLVTVCIIVWLYVWMFPPGL